MYPVHTATMTDAVAPGIQRWPRRQLLKMSKAMDKLEAKGSGDGSSTPAGPAGAHDLLSAPAD